MSVSLYFLKQKVKHGNSMETAGTYGWMSSPLCSTVSMSAGAAPHFPWRAGTVSCPSCNN